MPNRKKIRLSKPTRMRMKKKTKEKKYFGTINPNMKCFANDPLILKRAEEAKAFLRRVGVPKGRAPLEEL
jgi:hypothetical protein